MDELLKALKHFVTRDVIYILGGAMILSAVLHMAGRIPTADPPTVTTLAFLAFSYPVGFAAQNVFTALQLCTTQFTQITEPSSWIWRTIARHVYERQFGKKWIARTIDDVVAAEKEFLRARDKPEHSAFFDEYQRRATLWQMGTVIGPSAIIASAVCLVSSIVNRSAFDVVLCVTGGVVGLVLLISAWVKAAQCAQYMIDRTDIHLSAPSTEQRSG